MKTCSLQFWLLCYLNNCLRCLACKDSVAVFMGLVSFHTLLSEKFFLVKVFFWTLLKEYSNISPGCVFKTLWCVTLWPALLRFRDAQDALHCVFMLGKAVNLHRLKLLLFFSGAGVEVAWTSSVNSAIETHLRNLYTLLLLGSFFQGLTMHDVSKHYISLNNLDLLRSKLFKQTS